jgi:hypothetical protein
MEQIENKIIEASININKKVINRFYGDSLNLINICTLYSEYLKNNSEIFQLLFSGINNLPKSHAADSEIDLLLRISSVTLLGFNEIIDNSDTLKHYFNEKSQKSYHVSILYDIWKKNPLKFCRSQFTILLFGQYLSRLIKKYNYKIDQASLNAFAHQILGYLPSIIDNLENKECDHFLIFSHLIFGAIICYDLKVENVGNNFIQAFYLYFNNFMDYLKRSYDKRLLIEIIQKEKEHISFISYNLSRLPKLYSKQFRHIVKFIEKCLLNDIYISLLQNNDLRVSSICLLGLKPYLKKDLINKISKELSTGYGFSMILQMKDILKKSVEYRLLLRKKLENKGINFNNIQINDIINLIYQFDFQPFVHYIKHPINTILSRKGDCKALATVISIIALETGIRGNICLYFGADINQAVNNHVYIELYDKSKDKFIPINKAPNYKGIFSQISENYIIKYPINSLIKNTNEIIIEDISSYRQMLLDKILKKEHH